MCVAFGMSALYVKDFHWTGIHRGFIKIKCVLCVNGGKNLDYLQTKWKQEAGEIVLSYNNELF